MDSSNLAEGWPGEPAVLVAARREGEWRTVASCGDLDDPRPWASVTKLLTAWAAGIEVDARRVRLDDELGPAGSTLAHVLAHASGLGLEQTDPVGAPGTKRIYSNYGIDLAAAHLARGVDAGEWLTTTVCDPLSLTSTRVRGRAADGAVGSTTDLASFAREWMDPATMSASRRDAVLTVFEPDLAGIVPGFGRFDPCPWGLGVEVRGTKAHWMGDWPASSFGHFGRSGAMLLGHLDEGIFVVATSTVSFGPWAHDLWPRWTSRVRRLALDS